MAKTISNMADGIVTPCNCVPWNVTCGMWLWNHDSEFTKWQHPAMWHVRGSGRTCRWIRPAAAPCNVTRSSGIMTSNSPGGSTLQCGRWLWDDMSWNSPKRPPYWNSTSGFEFDHITAVDMSFCTSLWNFYPNRTTLSRKNDVMSIFKMADLSHLGFYGSNNGFFEKPLYGVL